MVRSAWLTGSLGLAALPGLALRAQSLDPTAYFQLAEQARTAFSIQGDGARAMGTGGAFIAIADDATAVSYNPAGLAQLLRPEGSLGVQALSRDLTFTGGTGQASGSPTTFEDTTNQDRHIRPSFASFALPWKSGGLNRAVLFSYQRIFDFAFDSSVRYLATASGGSTVQAIRQDVHQSGGIDLYSAAFAAELSPRILLGLSVNAWQGKWQFGSTSDRVTSGISTAFDSTLAQDSAFRGLNANLGLIWRSEWVNLGVVYRSPFTATYTFTNTYDHVDTTTGLPVHEHDPSTPASVQWPETLGWGLGLHLGPRVQVTADWTQTPWSKARYSGNGAPLDGRNWFDDQAASAIPNVRSVRAGLEWVAVASSRLVLPLRIGVFREPQPIVDETTRQQRVLEGWTAGFGLKFHDLTADVAFREARNRREVSRFNTDAPIGGVASTAYGSEQDDERKLYLSLIYQFDGTRIRKVLSWILVGG
ncbi:MAG TPA: hypothetical protein VF768_09280 [Holophagaceae bacterium]